MLHVIWCHRIFRFRSKLTVGIRKSDHARGTPVPIMATKKLLTDKPYSFRRNPMVLEITVSYFSIATFTSSFMTVLAVFLFALFLIAYIKFIEEKEMSLRFGDEYSRYKQSTPFIIPRLSLLKRKARAHGLGDLDPPRGQTPGG